ncbi:MAG: DUF6605 domain-containing protein [Planctomycetota bacterium]
MLVGYVSDERFVALPDVSLEFERDGISLPALSRATGSVHADLEPGRYRVTLQKTGFGAKRVHVDVPLAKPFHFRLLSDQLLGYAWPKWVKGGERSEFRVHSPEAYKLELWRYGWERRRVKVLGWFDEHGPRATVQITPDGDYSQTGVRWNEQGYTNPHHKQFVQAPGESGLYYFHALTAGGRHFAFPWIVAPAEPTARVAVLASNITWNAYNSFGGRSNYINPDRLPDVPTVNSRFDLKRYTDPDNIDYDAEDYLPLSFDRPEPMNDVSPLEEPTDPIEGRSACHLAPAEWRLLAWLEREQFAYDYHAETQLHDGTLRLEDYRVLILSTHPEYWSRLMYDRVKEWVFHRGGRLMYLGGNGLNCAVEFSDPHTMVVKNGDKRRLQREGRESRLHGYLESEANLLGVVFTDSGVMTGAPFRVIDPDHWVFEGTGLKKGDLFGESSLHMRCHGGASGHETDKVSRYSPPNVHCVAKGTNPDEGGAEMILHEPGGGGMVFSAGSIAYPASLLVDASLSRITANVLRRFLATEQARCRSEK